MGGEGLGSFAAAVAATGGQQVTADEPPAPLPTQEPPGAPATQAPQSPIGSEDQVVDPRTWEVFDPSAEPTDRLANLVLEYRRWEADLTDWRKRVEHVIRQRLEQEGRRVAVVGDYELSMDTGRSRVWDPEDLEANVRELIDQGVLEANWVTGLIHREATVNGRAAQRLLGQLTGEPKQLIEGCFRWEQKGRPRLTVNRVPDLADALPEGTDK